MTHDYAAEIMGGAVADAVRAAVAAERARREAAEAEVARLRAEAREAAQVLIEEVGADGPSDVVDAAHLAVARIGALIGRNAGLYADLSVTTEERARAVDLARAYLDAEDAVRVAEAADTAAYLAGGRRRETWGALADAEETCREARRALAGAVGR